MCEVWSLSMDPILLCRLLLCRQADTFSTLDYDDGNKLIIILNCFATIDEQSYKEDVHALFSLNRVLAFVWEFINDQKIYITKIRIRKILRIPFCTYQYLRLRYIAMALMLNAPWALLFCFFHFFRFYFRFPLFSFFFVLYFDILRPVNVCFIIVVHDAMQPSVWKWFLWYAKNSIQFKAITWNTLRVEDWGWWRYVWQWGQY